MKLCRARLHHYISIIGKKNGCPHCQKIRTARYFAANKQKINLWRRPYKAQWRDRQKTSPYFKAKNCHYSSKRRASLLKATPKWLTIEHWLKIEQFYLEAARLTSLTGISHHVDHIHPLQHPDLSGLHVPWNLQVIPAFMNLKKSNKLIML